MLYRPIAANPATNPLTALSVLCLGVGIALGSHKLSPPGFWLKRLIVMAVVVMTVLRLVQILSGIDLTSWVTPFHNEVLLEQHMGKSNVMGPNTATMLLSIAITLGFQCWGMPRASQVAAAIATAIPSISFIGYIYGHAHFYGQMSLISAIAGFCLAVGAWALTAERWMLAALLSPHLAGKLARTQMLIGLLVPVSVGYVLVRFLDVGAHQAQGLLSLLVVAVCAFLFLMIGISAIFQEKSDYERRQIEAKMTELAQTDALTGLGNRRKFFELGLREWEHIKRINGELWVLMIDVDHFKKINDTAGHGMGDEVLIAVADTFFRSIRKSDVVGRIGGEEFAVLLTDTNQVGCRRVAEGIRQNIESLDVPGWTDIHGAITASIGCARLLPEETLERAMSTADEALYQAKNKGRNRVCFGEEFEDAAYG